MREERGPDRGPVGPEPIDRDPLDPDPVVRESMERRRYGRGPAGRRRVEPGGERDMDLGVPGESRTAGPAGRYREGQYLRDYAAQFPARIYLQPIASPTVLGLFALASAVFVYGAWLAGWYGTEASPGLLFPFLGVVGGLAQLLAGMWAFRARDTLAALVFTVFGAFWLGYGVLHLGAVLSEALTIPVGGFSELGFPLFTVAVILGAATVAAVGRSIMLAVTFGALAFSVLIVAVGHMAGNTAMLAFGGWLLVISALVAVYTASALLIREAMGRELLPLFARTTMDLVDEPLGEPGVVRGDWVGEESVDGDHGETPWRRVQSRWEFQWPVRRKEAA